LLAIARVSKNRCGDAGATKTVAETPRAANSES